MSLSTHQSPASTLGSLLAKLIPLFVVVLLLAALAPGVASAQKAQPQATVVATKLNIRSGPGTEYSVLASAAKNEVLSVLGKSNNACDWLKVKNKKGQEGWVAGTAKYVKLNVACSTLTTVKAPAAPPKPTAKPTSPAQPAAPTPVPTAAEPQLPPGQGCYLLQNQLGTELNWTFSGPNGYKDNFKLAPDEQRVYCLDPGSYNVTVDAPPPWNSINFTLNVAAGNRDVIPIRAQ